MEVARQRVSLWLSRLEWFRIARSLGVRDDEETNAYFAMMDGEQRRRALRRVWFN